MESTLVGTDSRIPPEARAIHRASLSIAPEGLDINVLLQLISVLGPILAGLFQKKPQPAPEPTPVPVPTPGPVPVPVPPPPPPPVVTTRRVARLATHILGVEGWDPKNGHQSLGSAAVRAIRDGSQPCGAGYRIHLDVTPFDQQGKPFLPDPAGVVSPDNAQFLTHPELGRIEQNNRIRHYLKVNGTEYGPQGDTVPGMAFNGQDAVDLTSETDDYAMTPVLTVPQDIGLSIEYRVQYRADFEAKDGSVVSGDWSPEFRIKAWGF